MKVRRRRSRGYSIVEVVLAISVALILLPAVSPPLEGDLRRTGELYEQEAARLLVEGELARARDDAGRGAPSLGSSARSPGDWKSAERLDGLAVTRTVAPGPAGLLEVSVEARWRSRSKPGHTPERLALATWVAKP